MFGDEYYSFIETLDGYVIDRVGDDKRLGWYYCILDESGQFTPSNISVEYPASLDLDFPKHFFQKKNKMIKKQIFRK